MPKYRKTILSFVGAFILFSCSTTTHNVSFYYWKTNAHLSASEKEALVDFNTRDLYLHVFDIDKINDSLVPLGLLSNIDSLPDSISIIPVVFITNRSFLNTQEKEIKLLAKRVYEKISSILAVKNTTFNEIQMDCDWSESTKDNYFLFLRELKSQLGAKLLSSTIRLHQVKYPIRSGIPPIDKGVLMFYNMGKLDNPINSNSIYNKQDAQKYISYLSSYPLDLDIAFPLFCWQLQYRQGKMISIIPKGNGPDTSNNQLITKNKQLNLFEIKSSFLSGGRYYMQGDLLKTERLSKEELIEAAHLLAANKRKNKSCKLIFFDLDEYNLKSYSNETINEILDILN